MKVIIDDFGHDPDNDAAILDLLESRPNFFYGVSCALTTRNFDSFEKLKKINSVKKGLHLTLTNFHSLSKPNKKMPTFRNIMIQSCVSRHSLSWVETEIESQLLAFQKFFGYPPTFIDGHQHVQQLPSIRGKIISIVKKNKLNLDESFFVRNSNFDISTGLKLLNLGVKTFAKNLALGLIGRAFKNVLIENSIHTNSRLFGTYVTKANMKYSSVFNSYLKISSLSLDVLYCHPGFVTDRLTELESPQPNRNAELQFFRSEIY